MPITVTYVRFTEEHKFIAYFIVLIRFTNVLFPTVLYIGVSCTRAGSSVRVYHVSNVLLTNDQILLFSTLIFRKEPK